MNVYINVKKTKKIIMLRHKNEGLPISFLGVFFPTPPLLIPHFYDVIEGLSSSLNLNTCLINLLHFIDLLNLF